MRFFATAARAPSSFLKLSEVHMGTGFYRSFSFSFLSFPFPAFARCFAQSSISLPTLTSPEIQFVRPRAPTFLLGCGRHLATALLRSSLWCSGAQSLLVVVVFVHFFLGWLVRLTTGARDCFPRHSPKVVTSYFSRLATLETTICPGFSLRCSSLLRPSLVRSHCVLPFFLLEILVLPHSVTSRLASVSRALTRLAAPFPPLF